MTNYDPYEDPEFQAFQAELDRQCGADFTTGGHDPYGTNCDLLRGHDGPHQGGDPMGGDGRIEWRGGGTVAGDPVPNRKVRRIAAPPVLPETQRARRGHAFYPPATVALPALYTTDRIPLDAKVILAHYFVGACDWWLAEYDPADGVAFGYACLGDPQNAEWGYVPLVELEQVSVRQGLAVVERDLHWQPVPFAQVVHPCLRGATR